jgi:hypothetical protein
MTLLQKYVQNWKTLYETSSQISSEQTIALIALERQLIATENSQKALLKDYERLKIKVTAQNRILTIGTISAIVMMILKVINTILWARGIRLPRIVEIWL